MRDDWRIRIDVDEEHAERLLDRLGLDLSSEARELAKQLEGRRLVVSRDGETIFVYAGSRQEADYARAVVETELREAGMHATVTDPERWLSDDERWTGEPPSEYEPEEAARAHGYAPWEVRVNARSPGEAQQLADRLESEGRGVVRRHTYVLVGAASEEEARALAEQLHGQVEASGELVYEALPQNTALDSFGRDDRGTVRRACGLVRRVRPRRWWQLDANGR
jgi:hypothetical protein